MINKNNVYIALSSEQTVPNYVVFRKLEENLKFNQIFILTSDNQSKSKIPAKNLKTAISSYNNNINIIEKACGDGENIKKVEEELKNLKDEIKDYNIYLNITGGTKIMSLATYNFFLTNFPKQTKIYYSGYNSDKIICLNGNDNDNLDKYFINIEEYFKLYGAIIVEKENKIKQKREEIESKEDISKIFIKNYVEDENFRIEHTKVIEILLKKELNSRKKGIKFQKFEEEGKLSKEEISIIKNFCNKNNITIQDNILSKDNVRFITGDFLEFYTYNELKDLFTKQGLYPPVHIKINNNENEIDGIFIYNNELTLIECKTSLKNKQNDISKKVIEEREAFSNSFKSLKYKILFITLDEKIKETSYNRSKQFNQDWIFRNDILILKEKIKNKLGIKNG